MISSPSSIKAFKLAIFPLIRTISEDDNPNSIRSASTDFLWSQITRLTIVSVVNYVPIYLLGTQENKSYSSILT